MRSDVMTDSQAFARKSNGPCIPSTYSTLDDNVQSPPRGLVVSLPRHGWSWLIDGQRQRALLYLGDRSDGWRTILKS